MKKTEESPLRKMIFDRVDVPNKQRLYDVNAVKRVHIIGAGGVGSWVTIGFAMAGCQDIHVYDDDQLAVSNLNRLPFTLDDVGKAKTQILKEQIARIRPEDSCGTKVTTHGRVFEASDLKDVKDGDVVVICVDSAGENNRVLGILKDRKVRVIRGAYNADSVVVTDAEHQYDDGEGGYGAIPSYVAPPMFVAAMIMEKAYRNPNLEINAIPLGKIKGST